MPAILVLAFLTLSPPSGRVGFKWWSLLAVSPIFIIVFFGSVLHLMMMGLSSGHHGLRCHCHDFLSPPHRDFCLALPHEF